MNRLVSLRPVLFALVTLGVLALAQPVAAGPTVPHKESCNGKVAFPAQGVLAFSGQGVATHMGKYAISGGNQITPDGQIRFGTFTSVAADGATITGVYSGTYTNLPNNTVRFDVTVFWQQGTGRLVGVTGQAAVVALVNLNNNTYHYDTLGTWTFP
jgi:hypothetical protein